MIDSGRGVPNYASSITLGPDGARAFVPSKKDNTDRGLGRDGLALNTDNTVRTIVSQLDLFAGAEDSTARVDLDDDEMAVVVETSRFGHLVFVASQGTNKVDVLDAYDGTIVAGFATGLAPQGLALSDDGILVVQNFMSRSVSVFDMSGIVAGTDGAARTLAEIRTVEDEPLAPDVLLGKQIFYNADSPQMSQDGYVACASCHLDGGQDGRVWDFSDRGEGLMSELGGLWFVQRLTDDPAGRTQAEVAGAWVAKLTAAIRAQDKQTPITVGVIPWAHVWPNAKPLFYSPQIGKQLDFVSIHLYPGKDEVQKAIDAVAVYDVGKPLVIEETFPLTCTLEELDAFIEGTRGRVDGWMGHYFGRTIAEHRAGAEPAGPLVASFLEYWRDKGRTIAGTDAGERAGPDEEPDAE